MQFVREESQDKRISRGDDFAGDAWKNQKTGEVLHVTVGHDPNERCSCGSRDTEFVRSVSGTRTVHGYFEEDIDADIYYCNVCEREFCA